MQPVDICNMALSKMGARSIINRLTESTPAAVACNLWYDHLRRLLLRSAPWGFARKTIALTQSGSILTTPPSNDYPFLFNYVYPADCIKFRYLVPMPPPQAAVTGPAPGEPLIWLPWMMPRRDWRYVISNFGDAKVVTTNLNRAVGVYNTDVQNCDLFDEAFIDALSSSLANELIMPLAGNVALKSGFVNIAKASIDSAMAYDGNEAMPTTDHVPDWIAARGSPGAYDGWNGGPNSTWGQYNCEWSGGYGS